MRVDRNHYQFDQVLNDVPQGIATVRQVPYGSMVVAEKMHLMPMQKWIWQRANLGKLQILRDLGEDDT